MKILVRWILLSKDDWQMEDVRFLLQSDDMDVDKDQSLSFWSRWRERFCFCGFSAHSFLIWPPRLLGFTKVFFLQIWSLKDISSYYQFIFCLFSAFKQHRERFGTNSPRFFFSTSYSFGMVKTFCLKLWSPNFLVTSANVVFSVFSKQGELVAISVSCHENPTYPPKLQALWKNRRNFYWWFQKPPNFQDLNI